MTPRTSSPFDRARSVIRPASSGAQPQRGRPTSTSTSTSRTPPAAAASTVSGESTATVIRARSARAPSRRASSTSLASSRSSPSPAATMPSTSRTVAQVNVRCPYAAWRRASSVVLCALTCGRSRGPGSAAALVARLCSGAAASSSGAGVCRSVTFTRAGYAVARPPVPRVPLVLSGCVQSTAAPPRTGRTLGVVAYGTFLALMAYTAPLASLPDIAADLGAGVSASSWIVASTSVGLAAALVPAGALGDDVGRRRVFTAGAVLLAASSALAAPAPDAWLLVAARVLQGVASAAVLACGLALLGAAYPGRARVAATAWWGAAFGAGVALGPVLMALVQAASSWRITYVVLAGLSAALALVAPALLGESTLGRRRGVDPAGALLLAVGLGCLLTALTEGRLGWARPPVLALLAGAAVLLAAFVLHQLRATAPMIDLR